MANLQYLPLSGSSFSILALLLVVVLVVLQFGAMQYAFTRLGLGYGTALFVLIGSLVGGYFNIPIAILPGEPRYGLETFDFFGMRYVVPQYVQAQGTVLAVNVGGAVIPTMTSLYLFVRHALWLRGMLATFVVSLVCYALAQPVQGLGVAVPIFAPSLAAALVALALASGRAAPLAYICGSLGTLIGADIYNLGAIADMGAPVASIGGAGTFDGVFLIGVVAVLIASLPRRQREAA